MENKVIIKYYLSEEGQKDSRLKGMDGLEEQCIITDITVRLVRLCKVSTDENLELIIGGKECLVGYEISKAPIQIRNRLEKCYFDKVMTIEELLNWEEKRIKNLQIELNEGLDEIKRILPEVMRQESEEIEREYQIDKKKWITKYGSQSLKKSIESGNNMDKEYIEERSKVEFPEYELEHKRNVRWIYTYDTDPELINEIKEINKKGFDASIVELIGNSEKDKKLAILISYINNTHLIKTK